MKKIVLSLFALTLFLNINAQIITSNAAPYNTAAYLVNNVLLGQGVIADSISFTGNAAQLGFFSNGNTLLPALGLDSGIVISSGNINDIPPGGNQPSTDFLGAGDPDLLAIAQTIRPGILTSQDAAALEFDFTPEGDTVEFSFTFASDEYHTWINTDYNDIFAFFVSGPGIIGPYNAPLSFPNGAINIAQVPGTTDPITISTIHPGLNANFFVDNPNELSGARPAGSDDADKADDKADSNSNTNAEKKDDADAKKDEKSDETTAGGDDDKDAKKLMFASFIYLPIIQFVYVFDKIEHIIP